MSIASFNIVSEWTHERRGSECQREIVVIEEDIHRIVDSIRARAEALFPADLFPREGDTLTDAASPRCFASLPFTAVDRLVALEKSMGPMFDALDQLKAVVDKGMHEQGSPVALGTASPLAFFIMGLIAGSLILRIK